MYYTRALSRNSWNGLRKSPVPRKTNEIKRAKQIDVRHFVDRKMALAEERRLLDRDVEPVGKGTEDERHEVYQPPQTAHLWAYCATHT